jgi:hypothetical protein
MYVSPIKIIAEQPQKKEEGAPQTTVHTFVWKGVLVSFSFF